MPHSFHPFNAVTGGDMFLILLCYGIGCCTAGYYWVRWRTGMDIRLQGSGNVGAKNVGRIVGVSGFIVTLLIDGMKGAVAVKLAMHFGSSPEVVVASLVAVVVGHNWPLQLRFHGGKGIAASVGGLLAYDSWIVLLMVALFIPIIALLRSFTLSGLLAFAIAPLALFIYGAPNVDVAASSFVAMLILISHHKNIREEIASAHAVKEGGTHSPKDEDK